MGILAFFPKHHTISDVFCQFGKYVRTASVSALRAAIEEQNG